MKSKAWVGGETKATLPCKARLTWGKSNSELARRFFPAILELLLRKLPLLLHVRLLSKMEDAIWFDATAFLFNC
jgi:hypothetical protein